MGNGPPVVDLANFEERKEEIKDNLMKAATTVGMQRACRLYYESVTCKGCGMLGHLNSSLSCLPH